MARINQASLRAQLHDYRAQFEAIKQHGEASADTLALIDALFMLVDIVVAVFLERTTPKTRVTPVCRVHATAPTTARPTPKANPGPAAADRRRTTHAPTPCARSPPRTPARSPGAGSADTT